MKAAIITIGDEILLGHTQDTNSSWIANNLTELGIEVIEMYSVADAKDSIEIAVDRAMQCSDIVFVTGGLGPTRDDKTKQILADYFSCELVFVEELATSLKQMFESMGWEFTDINTSQAIVPKPCLLIKNNKGTAQGMWFEKSNKHLISMPGVPFEMQDMMEKEILPRLASMLTSRELSYKQLRVYHIPESILADMLSDWEDSLPEGITLAYLPSLSYVKLRLTARGNAISKLDECYETLKFALADSLYVEGNKLGIEDTLGDILKKRGKTLSCAESCSGGNISKIITSVAGASEYFLGGVVSYSNEMKVNVLGVRDEDISKYGAVSEQVVIQMAEGVKRITNSDYSISISGIAGPGGGSKDKPVGTIWIGIAGDFPTFTKKIKLSFTRERNIARASDIAISTLIDILTKK